MLANPSPHRPLLSGLLAGVVLTGALLLTAQATASRPAARDLPLPAPAGLSLPIAAVDGWSLEQLAPLIAAFRSGDLPAAQRTLADSSPATARAAQSQLLLGLYAQLAGDAELARRTLAATADATGLLEDWRLFSLAQASTELEQWPAARAALEELLSTHRDSPLYYRAYRRHLALTHQQGDWLETLRAIESARQEGLDGELAPEIDELQWAIASDHGLEQLQLSTARHLLVEHPLTASALEVVELFREEDGALDWPSILTAGEQLTRAQHLLAVDIVEGALATLDAVPEIDRDLDWSFLQARVLTANRQGTSALEVLARRPATPQLRLTELWQLRAAAALDAAAVRSGRRNADSATRQVRRDTAWRDLWQLASKAEPESRLTALRQLYTLADPEDDFALALDILQRLRALDATDITAYRDLWKLGWRSYARDDLTAAIGIWRELQDLYPETSRARQALYWSAVAHGRLGNRERGRDLLRQVLAADTSDFYSRHAARRLGVAARRSAARLETDRWPDDPRLARTALLSELGLDSLAATELELLRSATDKRAADGLEALILARQGKRRDSIQAIWRAFRSLGKPGQTRVPPSVRQLYYPLDYPDEVRRWATARKLPTALVYGIIRQESAFDAKATSRAGARGLMQLMPATGRELAGKLRLPYSSARLHDPGYSVQLGTQYFSQVLAMFDGDVELALAGYNGGPYRIRRWWREAGANAEIDRFVEGLSLSETTTYVKRILVFEDSYKLLYPSSNKAF